MLTPLTPARMLARAIESRAVEAQLIGKLVQIGDDLVGDATPADQERWERRRDDIHAVLHGASAMIGDLVEELGRLEDRALALQDAPRAPSAPEMPAAA